ncbi:MAG: cytochrome P450 [Bacteroidia bacterium]|nr:cytochrome P450 [Bacteroidia bacterium]
MSFIQDFALSILRAITPTFGNGKTVFVLRNGDVREILERDQDFTIEQINGENISRHTGPFILGMDNGPKYQRDLGILRRAVMKEDVQRVVDFIRKNATDICCNLSGQFDLVDAYTRQVPYLMLGDYFGVQGPDRASLLRWNRTIFYDIFLNLKDDQTARDKALAASKEMVAYLDDLIQERKSAHLSGHRLPNDMLSRLIVMQGGDLPAFGDDEIPGNLSGVFMGFAEPTNLAVVNTLRYLFENPKAMEMARKAADEGDQERMLKIALECMRFYPNAPAVMRYNAKEQFIGGKDGRKRRRIKAGKTLFVMTKSAMFDSRAVKNPKEFNPDRPRETYLYFGHGLHKCFGNYINFVSIPEILIALLKIKSLRPIGKLESEEGFPSKWMFQVN